jgi:hypothetical protein
VTSEKPWEVTSRANKAAASGDYSTAISLHRQVLENEQKKCPNPGGSPCAFYVAEAALNLGRAMYESGDRTGGEAMMRQAIAVATPEQAPRLSGEVAALLHVSGDAGGASGIVADAKSKGIQPRNLPQAMDPEAYDRQSIARRLATPYGKSAELRSLAAVAQKRNWTGEAERLLVLASAVDSVDGGEVKERETTSQLKNAARRYAAAGATEYATYYSKQATLSAAQDEYKADVEREEAEANAAIMQSAAKMAKAVVQSRMTPQHQQAGSAAGANRNCPTVRSAELPRGNFNAGVATIQRSCSCRGYQTTVRAAAKSVSCSGSGYYTSYTMYDPSGDWQGATR